jgi:hypothetical protein
MQLGVCGCAARGVEQAPVLQCPAAVSNGSCYMTCLAARYNIMQGILDDTYVFYTSDNVSGWELAVSCH